MELRILGPLEVVVGDDVVAPRAGKERSLLAFLALHPNQPVAADRLVDALWGERPPATATAALQNQVTRLRRLLGPDRIETAGSTYRLRLKPGELDADRFEELVREAASVPVGERVALLRSALSLWRGRALGGVEDELFASSDAARLEELRLVALEQRLDAELELEDGAGLVPELEGLTREHPLREGLRAKLMLALYRSGRQAEALEVYHSTRRLLVDELGIEPGQPLQRLHQRLLLQDADLEVRPQAGPGDVEPEADADATAPDPGLEQAPAAPAREVRKTVTAALLSVELTTAGDPEVLRGLGERAATAVRLAVERHGGRVDESAGAGALALFGVPVLHEDDALRAVRSAVEARAAVAALDPGIELRAGIATGVAIAGADVAGQPMQAARGLERRAGRGEILLAPESQRLVRDAVECEPVGDGALRLVRLDPTAPAIARRPGAPLVDRERELLLLETAFAHAVRSSTCHLFTVCGPAGIGKSRLVGELIRAVGDRATVLQGQCPPYGQGITYWPVVEIVRGIVGIGAGDDPVGIRERIVALVPAPDGEAVADRLTGLLGVQEPDQPPKAMEIAWALRRLLEAVAGSRPVILVVDDLQYAEPTLLDLLESLADRVRGAPILLAGLARPELLDTRPTWGGGQTNATTLSLDTLDPHDSGLLLANLEGGAALAPELRERVLAAAGGHPFFVEELVAMVTEPGRALDGDLALPSTVQVLLTARLEQLAEAERLVLECGAIEGETFHAAALDVLAPELQPEARESALRALERANLIRSADPQLPVGDAYRFRHALVREEAYSGLLKARRAELHERFADWLERVAGARRTEVEEILAFHLECAFRLHQELGTLDDGRWALGERAGRLLGSAGRRAYERSDMPAATSLLGRATALLPADDEERLRLLVDLGCAWRATGAFETSGVALREAEDRAGRTGRRGIQAHAEIELASLGTATDPVHGLDELKRTATAIVTDPAVAEEPVAYARACQELALWHWNALESAKAAAYFLRAREIGDAAGDRALRRRGQMGIALTFVNGPLPVPEALTQLNAFLDESRGDGIGEALLTSYAGALESMTGRFAEARSLLARGAAQLDDLGHRRLRANLGHYAVIAELAAGDPLAAERAARDALETLQEMGDREAAAILAAALAEALHAQGRDEEAMPQLGLAAELEPGAPLFEARVWTTRAKVLAARGETAAAVTLARKLVALLDPTDALVLKGDAQLSLWEALASAGELDDAAAAAVRAVAFYEAKGAMGLAAAAARLAGC